MSEVDRSIALGIAPSKLLPQKPKNPSSEELGFDLDGVEYNDWAVRLPYVYCTIFLVLVYHVITIIHVV